MLSRARSRARSSPASATVAQDAPEGERGHGGWPDYREALPVTHSKLQRSLLGETRDTLPDVIDRWGRTDNVTMWRSIARGLGLAQSHGKFVRWEAVTYSRKLWEPLLRTTGPSANDFQNLPRDFERPR